MVQSCRKTRVLLRLTRSCGFLEQVPAGPFPCCAPRGAGRRRTVHDWNRAHGCLLTVAAWCQPLSESIKPEPWDVAPTPPELALAWLLPFS